MSSRHILAAALAFALAAAPAAGQKPDGKGKPAGGKAVAAQQGKGSAKQAAKPSPQQGRAKAQVAQGRGNAQAERGPGQSASKVRGNAGNMRGQPAGKAAPGNSGSAKARGGKARLSKQEVRSYQARLPRGFRTLASSGRTADRFVAGAATYALARGLAPEALQLRVVDDRMQVRNRNGDVLFDMNEERARRLGVWELRSLGDQRVKEGAPAFCRSGEGHPVWGREWCVDKGFGLGTSNDRTWARSRVEDIIFGRRVEQARVDRGGLIDVLGDVVFGRLALHALALGLDQPLTGYFTREPDSPQILRIHSGNEPVAELVDLNGDTKVDLLYVSHY